MYYWLNNFNYVVLSGRGLYIEILCRWTTKDPAEPKQVERWHGTQNPICRLPKNYSDEKAASACISIRTSWLVFGLRNSFWRVGGDIHARLCGLCSLWSWLDAMRMALGLINGILAERTAFDWNERGKFYRNGFKSTFADNLPIGRAGISTNLVRWL